MVATRPHEVPNGLEYYHRPSELRRDTHFQSLSKSNARDTPTARSDNKAWDFRLDRISLSIAIFDSRAWQIHRCLFRASVSWAQALAINQAGSPFQSGMSRFFPCRTTDRDWGLIDKLIVSCKPYSLNGPYQSTRLTSWSWPMQPSPERRRVMSRVRSTKRSTKMS
jgi:hypothetical protein